MPYKISRLLRNGSDKQTLLFAGLEAIHKN